VTRTLTNHLNLCELRKPMMMTIMAIVVTTGGVYIRTYVRVCVYVCMYVCMCVCIIYLFIYNIITTNLQKVMQYGPLQVTTWYVSLIVCTNT
jgi:hypothetical protein